MIDINQVESEAKEIIRKEKHDAAVLKIKSKLAEIEKARTVLRNLERELEDIKADLGE